jgi:hypothetical protein
MTYTEMNKHFGLKALTEETLLENQQYIGLYKFEIAPRTLG